MGRKPGFLSHHYKSRLIGKGGLAGLLIRLVSAVDEFGWRLG